MSQRIKCPHSPRCSTSCLEESKKSKNQWRTTFDEHCAFYAKHPRATMVARTIPDYPCNIDVDENGGIYGIEVLCPASDYKRARHKHDTILISMHDEVNVFWCHGCGSIRIGNRHWRKPTDSYVLQRI
jgi:hypothetical protein